MTCRLPWASVIAIAVLCGTSAGQVPSFHANAHLVVLHATVMNQQGEPRTDLEQSAFAVFENGRRQPITLFRRDDIPVSLGVLLDNSGSMRTLRSRTEAAALAFVRASNPDDEVFIVNFADHIRLDVPMTRDVHALEAGVTRVDAIGGTALRDAVRFSEQYAREHAKWDRRALLIVTDGKDNASDVTVDQIQREAERSDTTVFAIGLFRNDDPSAAQGRKELRDITMKTGGLTYYPPDNDSIESTAVTLARHIRQQYTIGYTPTNTALDGTYRSIQVRASSPDRAERLTVHTRSGYRADRNQEH